MHFKVFIYGFLIVYLLMSLPAMLGIGYVIDWMPGATLPQKFNTYIVEGLTNHSVIKIGISTIVSVILTILVSLKHTTNK